MTVLAVLLMLAVLVVLLVLAVLLVVVLAIRTGRSERDHVLVSRDSVDIHHTETGPLRFRGGGGSDRHIHPFPRLYT